MHLQTYYYFRAQKYHQLSFIFYHKTLLFAFNVSQFHVRIENEQLLSPSVEYQGPPREDHLKKTTSSNKT